MLNMLLAMKMQTKAEWDRLHAYCDGHKTQRCQVTARTWSNWNARTLTAWPSDPPARHLLWRNEDVSSRRKHQSYMHTFLKALLTVAPDWEQPKCPFAGEELRSKLCCKDDGNDHGSKQWHDWRSQAAGWPAKEASLKKCMMHGFTYWSYDIVGKATALDREQVPACGGLGEGWLWPQRASVSKGMC